MWERDSARKKVVLGIALAAAGAAAGYAGYKLQRRIRMAREERHREHLLDRKVMETMDGSDAIATY